MAAIYARALAHARAYLEGGFDGVIVENHGDVSFSKPTDIGPEVPAHMASAAGAGILWVVDGVIVASSLKHGGVWWSPVDPDRVRAFASAAAG